MPIVLQPAYDILPSYRPVKFLLSYLSGFTVIVENALVTINKGGVAIGPAIPIKSSSKDSISFPGLIEYYFEVDIQKYCQDLLEPFTDLPSIFPIAGIPLSTEDALFFDLFDISVTYEVINPSSGLLEPAPGLDLSNQFYVFTAAVQHQANTEQWLRNYTGIDYAVDTTRLSSSPNPKKVCANDNEYINIIQNASLAINGIEIDFYNSTGALLSSILSFTGAQPNASQYTVNVGLNGISNLVALTGFFPPIADIASYNIKFGYVTVLGGPTYVFLAQTKPYIYNVQSDCCEDKTLRLHWMNTLGGSDSFTFKYDKDLILATSFDDGEKALGWATGSANPHNISDVGRMKIKSEGATAYTVDSGILKNAEALWLSGVLTSPKVYAELNGVFVPGIVDKKTQSISRKEGKIRISLTFMLANDLIIPRI